MESSGKRIPGYFNLLEEELDQELLDDEGHLADGENQGAVGPLEVADHFVLFHQVSEEGSGDRESLLVFQRQERGQKVEVVGPEDGGRVPAVAVGQRRHCAVVEEVLLAGHGHVGRPHALHFVLRVGDHLSLAQHPVHFVLLAEQTERLEEQSV